MIIVQIMATHECVQFGEVTTKGKILDFLKQVPSQSRIWC